MGCRFNSRPSRDGRQNEDVRKLHEGRVSIHARLATGDTSRNHKRRSRSVSIHARLATGDRGPANVSSPCECFNSRPSRDGRPDAATMTNIVLVSIHARLATGDSTAARSTSSARCFNSRPSRDGRQEGRDAARMEVGFNSRPSRDGRPRQFMQLSPSKSRSCSSMPNIISYIFRDCTRALRFFVNFLVKELISSANLPGETCSIEVRGHCMHHARRVSFIGSIVGFAP